MRQNFPNKGNLLIVLGALCLLLLFALSLCKNLGNVPLTLSSQPRIHSWTGPDHKPKPLWGPTPHPTALCLPTQAARECL